MLPRTHRSGALGFPLYPNTSRPSLSSGYINRESCNCLRLLRHWIPCAFVFDLLNAGRSRPARMAIIAITTSSSISVKAGRREHPSVSVKRDGRVAEFITSDWPGFNLCTALAHRLEFVRDFFALYPCVALESIGKQRASAPKYSNSVP